VPAQARTARNAATRTSILDAAERLFAEHGVHEVSNRQVAWYARFGAQVMTDPALRAILVDEHLGSPVLLRVLDGLHACLPSLPLEVFRERSAVGRHLLVHVPAERERALADGTPTVRATWADTATGLVDVLVGVWLAPVTPTPG
jgi:Bacterial regulatory proteins, tetR family